MEKCRHTSERAIRTSITLRCHNETVAALSHAPKKDNLLDSFVCISYSPDKAYFKYTVFHSCYPSRPITHLPDVPWILWPCVLSWPASMCTGSVPVCLDGVAAEESEWRSKPQIKPLKSVKYGTS